MNFGYDYSIFKTVRDFPSPESRSSRSDPRPLRVLSCPEIPDDFYSNLLDWKNGNVYYAISDTIFCYSFYSEKVEPIFHSGTSSISSIKSSGNETLCIGTTSGLTCFIDLPTLKYSKYLFHRSRISVLESYENYLVSGSRDRRTKIIDIRTHSPVEVFNSHMQEVCGIGINSQHTHLASGGNDNKVFVYDLRKPKSPMMLSEHRAAVKAISWSPICPQMFVTGGGSADKTIKLWDLRNQERLVKSYEFESQICNLRWMGDDRILSTFGYSNDDIKLLKDFRVERTYRGHKNRVIHFAVDEEEKYFVSGSGDSTIRIWEIDPEKNRRVMYLR